MTRAPACFSLFLAAACAAPRFTTRSADARVTPLGAAVFAVTRVPMPWWAPRAVVRSRFEEALPEYEAIDGLARKTFVISDAGQFGGLYVWRSLEAAQGWFSPKWFERVKGTYGGGDAELFTALSALDGQTQLKTTALDARSSRFPMTATLLRLTGAGGARADALAAAHRAPAGFVRGWLLTASDGALCLVSTWADRASARSAYAPEALETLRTAAGASSTTLEWFEAPVFMDEPGATRLSRATP